MRLIYHPDAEKELVEAVRFYEQKVPGLGDLKHHSRHPSYWRYRLDE
ncbi:MAG TPA: hypothetical protein VGC93_17245 [Thermoanaerobaculia bacterium]